MYTSLDLLIIVVMALAAASLLALALMFLIKNKTAQRVCLYIVAGMGVYFGYVGARILLPTSLPQAALAVMLAIVCIGAVVLERFKQDNRKIFLLSRIAASLALVIGFFNAFF